MSATAAAISCGGRRRRGFSLVEAMVAMVLVAVLLVAAMRVLGATARARYARNRAPNTMSLAQDLMSEILGCAYDDPESPGGFGLEPGESLGSDRSAWDDVDDYDGWSSTPPLARDGSALAGYDGWQRTVIVERVDPASLAALASAAPDTGLRRITVTVIDPDQRPTIVQALRARFDGLRAPTRVDSPFVTRVGIELDATAQLGPSASSGAAVLSQQPGPAGGGGG